MPECTGYAHWKLWCRQLMLRWVFVFAMLASIPAFAQGTVSVDGPIIGGTFRLDRGDSIVGEVTSVGAHMLLSEDSVVAGRVNVVGGTLTVEGRVNGVIHVYLGELSLAETAVVEGSVHADWARVERHAGAVVTNAYDVGSAPAIRFELPAGIEPVVASLGRVASPGSTWSIVLRGLGLAIVTAIGTALIPGRLRTIADEALHRPVHAVAFGLAIAITAVVVAVLFVVTLVGIPVAFAIGVAVWFAALVGLAAISQRVGTWLERRHDRGPPSLTYAAMGGLVVGLLLGSLASVPGLGGLLEALASLVALGALATSGLGSSGGKAATREPPSEAGAS